jgi:hypothetical protein
MLQYAHFLVVLLLMNLTFYKTKPNKIYTPVKTGNRSPPSKSNKQQNKPATNLTNTGTKQLQMQQRLQIPPINKL